MFLLCIGMSPWIPYAKPRPLLLASVALTIAEKFEAPAQHTPGSNESIYGTDQPLGQGDKDFAQLKDLNDAMGDHASNEELVRSDAEETELTHVLDSWEFGCI